MDRQSDGIFLSFVCGGGCKRREEREGRLKGEIEGLD